MEIDLAVIGGTGIYEWPGLEQTRRELIQTEFGSPSAPILVGYWQDKCLAFLPRHGASHLIPPHAINYRANLKALKELGASEIVSINAVGGINQNMQPLPHLVIPDQIIDYTYGRISSFFNEAGDTLRHIDFTEPYNKLSRRLLIQAAHECGIPCSTQGTYACTQGPRLETRAEIVKLEKDGCDIVGMTGMPEAALAKELDLGYASICIIVNPAAGKAPEQIELDAINANMEDGIQSVRKVLLKRLGT